MAAAKSSVMGQQARIVLETTAGGEVGAGNPLPVSPVANSSTTAATITQATKTVAASGTPERLAAVTTLCESVLLEGKKARGTVNTGNVYLGPASANDAQLLEITPGAQYVMNAPAGKKIDLYELYADAVTNGDGITYTILN